jgi:hypothetical protein
VGWHSQGGSAGSNPVGATTKRPGQRACASSEPLSLSDLDHILTTPNALPRMARRGPGCHPTRRASSEFSGCSGDLVGERFWLGESSTLGFEAGIDHGPRSDASVTRWPLLVFHLGHPWKGRNEPHCQDRRWVTAWRPEQISHRLKPDFPDHESMRISHEAIYQALYIRGRGALKRELIACLRTGRALRVPRARTRQTA